MNTRGELSMGTVLVQGDWLFCYGRFTRGSHIHVACRSVCDRDQESWTVKIVLNHLIALFWGSWLLDSTGVQRTNVATPAKYLRKCVDRLILVTQNSSRFLDQILKRTLLQVTSWFRGIAFERGPSLAPRPYLSQGKQSGEPSWISWAWSPLRNV